MPRRATVCAVKGRAHSLTVSCDVYFRESELDFELLDTERERHTRRRRRRREDDDDAPLIAAAQGSFLLLVRSLPFMPT